MRIPILVKMFIMVAIILVGVMSVVLWNTNQVFYEDKKAFVVQLTNKISTGISRLLQDRLQNYRNKLAIFTGNYESLDPVRQKDPKVAEILFAQYGEFLSIGLVPVSNPTNPKWFLRNPQSKATQWAQGFEQNILSSVKIAGADSGLNFQKIVDENGKALFAMMTAVELAGQKYVILGVTDAQLLSDLVQDYKGDLNTVFIVDPSGVCYAHPNTIYIGASLRDHPLVDEIVKELRPSGAGEGLDQKGEKILDSYSKQERSNLYVIVSTPKAKAFEAANQLFRSLMIAGAGVFLFGLGLALVFSNFITGPLIRLRKVAAEIGKGNFNVEVPAKSNDEVGDLAESFRVMGKALIERDEQLDSSKQALVQSEKMSAFGQLSAGIAHEVKNPLAGILGHAQLAKGKIHDNPDLFKHLDVIEKETRRTREIIDNLMRFSRSEKPELIPTDIRESVSRACDLVEHQLKIMDVHLEKHINPVPEIQANSNQLQQVLLNIMMNAGHAMEKSVEKKLIVYLDHIPELKIVRIRLKDTGTGIPKEHQVKIFEPFFTTKPAGKGTGLGLSVSIGIVKDHKGKIYVESEMGKGTTFFIDLPIPDAKEMSEALASAQVSTHAVPESAPAVSEVPPAPAFSVSKPMTTAPADASVSPQTSSAEITQVTKTDLSKPMIELPKPADLTGLPDMIDEDSTKPVMPPPFVEFANANPQENKSSFQIKKISSDVQGMPQPPALPTEVAEQTQAGAGTFSTKIDFSEEKTTTTEFTVKVRKPKLKV